MVQLYIHVQLHTSFSPSIGVAPKIYSCMRVLCIVMFNLGVFAVFCFYFARWGLYNLYFLLTSWLTAMGLSALMVASVLKVTGSSALMVVSMMDGSDGRTQQSNLMVVGKIGGGI